MTVNAHAYARPASNAGRMQIIDTRFTPDNTLTPGVSSAWAAYASIIASLSGNWQVLGAYVRILGVALANASVHLQGQIATGAAGSEVPFASFGDAFSFLTPAVTGSYVSYGRTFLFPPIYMPSGTVVRATTTVDNAGTVTRTHVSLFGVPAPYYLHSSALHRPEWFERGRTGLGPSQAMADFMILPTPLTYTTVSLGSSAFGSWATAITAANQTQPLLITGMKVATAAAGMLSRAALMEIGIGEAASAVGIEEVKFGSGTGLGFATGVHELYRPIYIPAGSGLSLRGGTGTASQTISAQILAQVLK